MPEYRSIDIPLRQAISEHPVLCAIVNFQPIFVLPRCHVFSRHLYRGHEAFDIIRMRSHQRLGRVLAHFICSEPEHLPESATHIGHARAAIGA